VSRLGVERHDDHRNARAVAKEVHRLHVSRIVIASAFVEGDEDGRTLPKFRIGFNGINDVLGEAFEQVQFGGGGECRR